MKRITLLLSLLLIGCQSTDISAKSATPQKVYRIVYEIESNDWYKQQAELWKNEIDKNPQNEEAWYNYYNANRYAHFEDIDRPEKKARLKKIISDMSKAIPNSYTYALLLDWNTSNIKDLSLTQKAYDLNPNRPDTYYNFISHYLIHGKQKEFAEFCHKLYKSRDIAPWLMDYNYNVLMSTEKNAILFTNGDNDTYPALLLQQVKSVRPDVTILNASMLPIKSYFNFMLKSRGINLDYDELKKQQKNGFNPDHFLQDVVRALNVKHPEIPIYFAVTLYSNKIAPFEDDTYLTGLAFRYSTKRIDNLALVKKNLLSHFRLDYLHTDIYNDLYPGKNLRANTNLNYIKSFMLMADHYKLSGQIEKASKWKDLAVQLAVTAKKPRIVKNIEESF